MSCRYVKNRYKIFSVGGQDGGQENSISYRASTGVCGQDVKTQTAGPSRQSGARTSGKQVTKGHNQAGHTIGELERARKPPLGWVWGDFYGPWHRAFPCDRHFNGDVNIRREYTPLSLLELQRIIDLGYLDTTKLIDICALCSTKLVQVKPEWRQFGISLTDEGSEIFAAKINLEVQWASMTCIAAVEKAGGRIRTAYYDLESLKAAVDPEKWFSTGQPIPPRKMPPHSVMDYYTNPNYRGYLADVRQSTKVLTVWLKLSVMNAQVEQMK
uniref:Large ribosomal subunit protein uL15m n=1 Tax=Ditylenchus dipsaci TaxID=166011 RepID=A0A915ETJ5_9BILA